MILLDRLQNLVSGLGGGQDKRTYTSFAFNAVPREELNAMHRSDWLARKVVDIIPNDMTREWREWQAKSDQIEAIEAVEKSPLIGLQAKTNDALRKARLFGGSAIFIGIRGADHSMPLDVESVGKGALEYLHVLHRHEITPGDINNDVTDPYFGEPIFYRINGANGEQVEIHPSRMIRFVGAQILDREIGLNDGWGDSVLQIVYDAIQNAGSVQEHVAALIPEMLTDIIYVPELSKHLQNPASTEKLTERFGYAKRMKSLFRMTLLEGNGGAGDNAKGEKWDQKQLNFSQMPELIQQYLQIAAGASDIPVTRLLGQSPSGMNSTGESDLRNYYDNVAARQRIELQPRLQRLDAVVQRSALGAHDPSIYYTWSPLWSLSDKEKAEVFKMKADAARIIAGTGGMSEPLMPIEALSKALINEFVEDGSLAGLEAAIEEFGYLDEQDEDSADEQAAALARVKTVEAPKPQNANDAAPRSLYVSRKLLNGADLIAWAKGQGFDTTLPADDMHVTITYSRNPVDWFDMGSTWDETMTAPPGGARMMEQFGEATVLLFSSNMLKWRHDEMVELGATWDHPEYQPHVTISYGFKGDLAGVEPYQGELVFGPEVFSEVKEDWAAGLSEE